MSVQYVCTVCVYSMCVQYVCTLAVFINSFFAMQNITYSHNITSKKNAKNMIGIKSFMFVCLFIIISFISTIIYLNENCITCHDSLNSSKYLSINEFKRPNRNFFQKSFYENINAIQNISPIKKERKLFIDNQIYRDSQLGVNIYMDWYYDSDRFGYLNFKAFESILMVYPISKIRLQLILPSNAHYYKLGNALSKTHFLKYKKMGYDVEFDIHHKRYLCPKIGKNFNDFDFESYHIPGCHYWNQYVPKKLEKQWVMSRKQGIEISSHAYYYNRFVALYNTGGIYSDFTYFHKSPVKFSRVENSFKEGAMINGYCQLNGQLMPLNEIRTLDEYFSKSYNESTCFFSSLMVFNKKSQVLECLLYDHFNQAQSDMRQCIDKYDISSQIIPIFCIKKALFKCFQSKNATNSLSRSNYNIHDIDDLNFKIQDTDTQFQSLSLQFTSNALENDNFASETTNNSGNMKIYIPISTDFGPTFLWYGISGINGYWNFPTQNGFLLELIKKISLENIVFHENKRAFSLLKPHPKFNKINTCNTFQLIENASAAEIHGWLEHFRPQSHDQHLLARYLRQSLTSCSPNFALVGYMKAGSTFIFDVLSTHSKMVKNLRGVSFKETGCYFPKFIASSKASSFNNILESLNMTTKRFLHYPERINCYPFIQPTDPFQYGDGSILYSTMRGSADILFNDNPNMKILFSIRNPVSRTSSHHRFSYKFLQEKGIPDPNIHLTEFLDPLNSNIMELHSLALEALNAESSLKQKKIEEIVHFFFNKIKKKSNTDPQYRLYGSMIIQSIYFPSIYYWYSKIPNKLNLKVIVAEEFSASLPLNTKRTLLENIYPNDLVYEYVQRYNQSILEIESIETNNYERKEEKLSKIRRRFNNEYMEMKFYEVFDFLELGPSSQVVYDVGLHQTGGKIKMEHRLNKTTIRILDDFFRPFNLLLEQFLNRSIGYNDRIFT